MGRFLGMLILFAVVWILPAPPAVAEMATVPAGEFMMGCSVNDADCGNDEGSQGGVAINIPEFRIDKYEVKVSEYGV